MDFLAIHDYDVWAINLHGDGRSDKTDKDWTDSHAAAADIAAAADYMTRLRGERAICSVGPQVPRELEYVLLSNGGHALMLEKDHRRFQHEVLSFFDRP